MFVTFVSLAMHLCAFLFIDWFFFLFFTTKIDIYRQRGCYYCGGENIERECNGHRTKWFTFWTTGKCSKCSYSNTQSYYMHYFRSYSFTAGRFLCFTTVLFTCSLPHHTLSLHKLPFAISLSRTKLNSHSFSVETTQWLYYIRKVNCNTFHDSQNGPGH